jgi:hypothetical protein
MVNQTGPVADRRLLTADRRLDSLTLLMSLDNSWILQPDPRECWLFSLAA